MKKLDWKLKYKDFEITREILNFKWTHSISKKKYFFPYQYKAVNIYSGDFDDNGNPLVDRFWNGEDRLYAHSLENIKLRIKVYHEHPDVYFKYKMKEKTVWQRKQRDHTDALKENQ